MKLIDKYLLRTFLVPFAYVLAAFVLLYVIYDLFDNLPDFVEGKTPIHLVAKYYSILMPSVLVRIVPISLLLAVLYSLASLTKNNELTAMRASGVSLLRLMVPLVITGFCASLVVLAVNESLGPGAAYWCNMFLREQRRTDPETAYIYRDIGFKAPADNRFWFIGKVNIRDMQLTGIEILQQREDKSDEAKFTAKEGRWLDGRWWLSDVVEQRYDETGNPKGPPRFALSREMIEFSEKPDDILKELKDPEYLSSLELRRYINGNPNREKAAVARLAVDLHHRLALPWACFIVTLLGIPFGAQTGRKGAMLGIALSLGLFFGFYVLIHLGLWLGKQMLIPAWLAGWIPNLVFLTAGSVMVYRMR